MFFPVSGLMIWSMNIETTATQGKRHKPSLRQSSSSRQQLPGKAFQSHDPTARGLQPEAPGSANPTHCIGRDHQDG